MNEIEMKFDVTTPVNDTPVEMNFSSEDGGENKHHNSPRPSGNNRPASHGYWPLILIGIAFITLVGLLIYFFAFRTTSNVKYYGNNAVVYSVDVDNDGTIDSTPEGYPDLAGYNSTAKEFGSIVVSGSEGELAKLLLDGKNNKVAASAQTEQHPLSVFCNGKQAFLLTDTGVYRVKRNGKLREVCTLSEMERGFVMVGGDAFHYNKNTLFKN